MTSVGGRAPASGVGDPDRRAHLEDERDFLLASLRDLDDELAAGDIAEDDHRRLKDDYTARAAEVLRALDEDARRTPARSRRPRGDAGDGRGTAWRWAAVVVLVGALAGVLVAQAAGDRGTGGLSGDIRESSAQLLADARQSFAAGDADAALEAYDEVLAMSPTNLEALTYKAWVGRNAGELDDAEALALLDDALAVSPGYVDAQVFRAVVLESLGRPGEAAEQFGAIDATTVPPYMVDLVASFGLRVADALVAEGDVEGANRTLDAVLAVAPEHLPTLVTKGTLLAAVAEATEGEASAEVGARATATMDEAVTAAESQPADLAAALLARAEVRAGLDDPEGARADLARLDTMDVPAELEARIASLRDTLG